MKGVPEPMPVTIPVPEPMVASVTLLLLQFPPDVGLLNVIVVPTHTFAVPDMAAGNGFIVTGKIVWQPVGKVYEIETTPAVMPVTIPVPLPIVATEVLSLVHVPPLVVSLKVIVNPSHTFEGPVIDAGNGFTTTTALSAILLKQPLVALVADTVYVPATLCNPKLRAIPVPAIREPTGVPPRSNCSLRKR
jgi:hypothetical protein